MRKLTIILLTAAPLFAQTARYPSAVATNADLTDLADRAQTTLTGALNSTGTSFTVVSGSKFAANMIVTIDSEQIRVCSVVGNTVNIGNSACPNVDGRGFSGTSAASHPNGTLVSDYFVAYQFKALREEVKALETTLGVGMANVPQVTYPIAVNKGGTGAATFTGIMQGNGTSAMTPVAAASQLQVLRRAANVAGTVYEFANNSALNARDYGFPVQATPENLSPSLRTVTVSPVPLGVNATDVGHYVAIFNNAGTFQEAVLINGGSAVAGTNSGTLTFASLSGTYSTGAYKVGSASGGIQEAIIAAGQGGSVYIPSGTYIVYQTIWNQLDVSMIGAGRYQTVLQAQNATTDVLHIKGGAVAIVTVRSLGWNAGVTRTGGSYLLIDNISFGDFGDIYMNTPFDGITVQQAVAPNIHNIDIRGAWNQAINIASGYSHGFFITDIEANSSIVGSQTNNLIHIGGQVAGSTIQNANLQGGGVNIRIDSSTGVINELLFTNITLDSWAVYGIYADGANGGFDWSFANIKGATSVATSSAMIRIQPGFGTIDISGATGAYVGTGSGTYGMIFDGAANVAVRGFHWYGNNVAPSASNTAILIASNSGTPVDTFLLADSILGYGPLGGPTSAYSLAQSIVIDGAAHKNITIRGNQLSGITSGMANFATGSGPITIEGNDGIDSVIPAVASAASITPPVNRTFTVTGTTAITTIVPGTSPVGRTIKLVFVHATPGGVGTGGNIARTQAAAQYQSITLTWNGTTWY